MVSSWQGLDKCSYPSFEFKKGSNKIKGETRHGVHKMVGKKTYEILLRSYGEDIERERRKLAYFEDVEVNFFRQEVLEALKKAKAEKVVDLARVRRLLVSLLAIEKRMKEKSGGSR